MPKSTIAALLLLAAPAGAQGDKPTPTELQGRVTGKPVTCLQTTRIDRTDRVSDRVILFHLRGGRVYRNDLPAECPRLSRPGTVISYSVPAGNLCRGDIIRLFDAGGGIGYGSCALGAFAPYELPKRER